MKRVILAVFFVLMGLALAQTSVRVGVLLPISTVAGKAALNGIQLAAD